MCIDNKKKYTDRYYQLKSLYNRRANPCIWDFDWLIMRTLARHISKMLEKHSATGQKALDIGCGTQPYREICERQGIIYLGADFGEESDIIIDSDGKIPLPDASFDLVLSFQVLEHVANLDRYLGEVRRVLRPNGRLFLSTHGTWLYHPHPEDHRRWTRIGLELELDTQGFKVEECISLVGPLAWTTIIRLAGFTYALRLIPVFGHAFGRFAALIFNIRAWLEDKITPSSITRDNACVYLVRAKLNARN